MSSIEENEALLNYQLFDYATGDNVVHIWTGSIYIIEKRLGKNSFGWPSFYVTNRDEPNLGLSTMDSTVIAPADHRIVRVIEYWKNKLRTSGKRSIVIGKEKNTSRLLYWFISTSSEYAPLVNANKSSVEFLYYWTLL